MRAAIGGGKASAGIDLRDAIGKSQPTPQKSIVDRRVAAALASLRRLIPPPPPSAPRLDFDAVVVAPAAAAHSGRPFTNVFVKNFRDDVTDEQFRAAFACCGAITSAVVARDGAGKSKRHGFVNFEQAEAALQCTRQFNGSSDLASQGEQIDVVEHLKKSERFAPAAHAKPFYPKVRA
jgi:hypothetical protein